MMNHTPSPWPLRSDVAPRWQVLTQTLDEHQTLNILDNVLEFSIQLNDYPNKLWQQREALRCEHVYPRWPSDDDPLNCWIESIPRTLYAFPGATTDPTRIYFTPNHYHGREDRKAKLRIDRFFRHYVPHINHNQATALFIRLSTHYREKASKAEQRLLETSDTPYHLNDEDIVNDDDIVHEREWWLHEPQRKPMRFYVNESYGIMQRIHLQSYSREQDEYLSLADVDSGELGLSSYYRPGTLFAVSTTEGKQCWVSFRQFITPDVIAYAVQTECFNALINRFGYTPTIPSNDAVKITWQWISA